MAWQESDLTRVDAAIADGRKSVTFADGRKVEYHSLDELRRLRADMKAELAASASAVSPRTRAVVGRVRHR